MMKIISFHKTTLFVKSILQKAETRRNFLYERDKVSGNTNTKEDEKREFCVALITLEIFAIISILIN